MARQPSRPPQPPPKAKGRGRARGGGSIGKAFRLARTLHAYLSAFAFLILLLFSITGLFLNHPDWLGSRPPEQVRTVRLTRVDIEQALHEPSPARALAEVVGRLTPTVGPFASGDIADGQALIRLEGPPGTTDITITLATGETEVATRRASLIAMLDDLHKGKAAGPTWRLVIDASAILFISLSILGYVLFFSLRYRLLPALILTALSVAALVATALLLAG